jgi:hypothetical protein
MFAMLEVKRLSIPFFERVPEGKAGKNRVHVCLQPDGTGWVVLADPAGSEFCVLRSRAERGF